MTDRINSLIVVLEHDICVDDAQGLAEAIKQFSNVLSVTCHPANISQYVTEQRVKQEMMTKLIAVVNNQA